eukprot:m51a1_g5721 putative C-tail anchored protein (137) ;mRNA; r:1107319-1108002
MSKGKSEREELFGGAGSAWAAAPPSENPEIASLDNRGVLDMQHAQMTEQDTMLDVLSESLTKQKHIANGIGDELDVHASLLTDLERGVDRADARVSATTANTRDLTEKVKNSCMIWTIGGLFLVIILLVVLMFVLP